MIATLDICKKSATVADETNGTGSGVGVAEAVLEPDVAFDNSVFRCVRCVFILTWRVLSMN